MSTDVRAVGAGDLVYVSTAGDLTWRPDQQAKGIKTGDGKSVEDALKALTASVDATQKMLGAAVGGPKPRTIVSREVVTEAEKRVSRIRAYYARKLGRSVEQLERDGIGSDRWALPETWEYLESAVVWSERRAALAEAAWSFTWWALTAVGCAATAYLVTKGL